MPLFLACVLHVVPIVLRLLFCRCLSVAFVVLFFGLFDVWHSVLCVCVFSVCFVVSGETNMQKFCDLVNCLSSEKLSGHRSIWLEALLCIFMNKILLKILLRSIICSCSFAI